MKGELFEIIKKAEEKGRLSELKNWLMIRLTAHKQTLFPEKAKHRSNYIHPVLDGLQQHQNGSAILRTTDALGFFDVSILDRQDFAIEKNISKGTHNWLSVNRYSGTLGNEVCLGDLKKNGYRVAVANVSDKALLVENVPLEKPLAVVLGSEVNGVSDFWRQNAELEIYHPMYGFAESLNVSVAWGILGAKLRSRLEQEVEGFLFSETDKERLVLYWAMRTIPHADLMIQSWL